MQFIPGHGYSKLQLYLAAVILAHSSCTVAHSYSFVQLFWHAVNILACSRYSCTQTIFLHAVNILARNYPCTQLIFLHAIILARSYSYAQSIFLRAVNIFAPSQYCNLARNYRCVQLFMGAVISIYHPDSKFEHHTSKFFFQVWSSHCFDRWNTLNTLSKVVSCG